MKMKKIMKIIIEKENNIMKRKKMKISINNENMKIWK